MPIEPWIFANLRKRRKLGLNCSNMLILTIFVCSPFFHRSDGDESEEGSPSRKEKALFAAFFIFCAKSSTTVICNLLFTMQHELYCSEKKLMSHRQIFGCNQGGQCILFYVFFIPPPSHHVRVWLLPVIFLLLSLKLTLYRGCGLAHPYD